jgi:hydroxymethylpyrimidine pyrophosphatase-like HAD family hydrolase
MTAADPPLAPLPDVDLVCLDIDGTLIDHDGRLSDRVRSAVQDTAAKGVHVVLATGRDMFGTLPVLDRLGLLTGWAVCSNGAVTLRLDPSLPKGYEVADSITFDPMPALKLIRDHLPTALFAVEELDVGFRMTAPFPPGELDEGEVQIVGFDELAVPTTRVVVRMPERTAAELLEVVHKVGLQGVSYAVGWTAWLDLNPEGVSKASGLEGVRARLGIAPEATLAIGDWRNDLPMFAWAGYSVAMGQGLPEVRAAADAVTASVTEDGVALVLERLPPR